MIWQQIYDPIKGLINVGPEYVISALVAGIPLYLLFYMLAVKRTAGHKAAIVGTLAALILAIVLWKMPADMAIYSTLMGACFGLFPIVWIVITAVWIYQMTVESGEFEIIKNSLAGLTNDRRLQAIFIAFAFGSFIEGTAGFGTPVAITAAMLVGLGFNPLYAAGICLIANTAPVAFGAIGVPIETAARASGLDINHISSIVGRQLPFLSIIVPFWVCWTMSGLKNTLEVLPALLVSGLCFAGSQFAFSNFHGPYLPDIMSAIVTIIGMVILLKVWKPKNIWHFPDEKGTSSEIKKYTLNEVLRAWSSYIILAVMVFIWGLGSFKAALAPTVVTIHWPGLDGLVQKVVPIVPEAQNYAATFTLNIATAAGTAIFIAGLISCFIMPNYGLGKALPCFLRTVKQLKFPILTIVLILGLSNIMNYSGMSSTLALAFTNAGFLFPFFAPIIGWLGVFLTGSDTSSNALFCGLQRTTAEVVGIDPNLAVAANSSGGVTGKMISPQSISVATAATGLIGKEGNLFRFTLIHSVAMTLVVCLITLLQAYWLSWMLP
ncbi:MAG: lactate permease LctP family transporter [Deltaproteobacteria bacterium]|jgi:lactate permease|nr:lactate permease LctP family transporter [Deltaproteobacteria bacterium]